MNKVEVDFGAWLEEAFDLYRDHFPLLALTGAIGGLLSLVTAGVLGGPMMAGMAMIVLALLDQREPQPLAGEIFKGFEFFLPSFLLTLLVLGASLLLHVILRPLAALGLILLQTVTMFSIFLIVEQKRAILPAITGSFEIVKTNFWQLLALQLIAAILAGLGLFACCVGMLVTWPFATCVTAIAFRHITSRSDEPAIHPEPPRVGL